MQQGRPGGQAPSDRGGGDPAPSPRTGAGAAARRGAALRTRHGRQRPRQAGTIHVAGASSPMDSPMDMTTRTPPGAGSTRKRHRPCSSPITVQPHVAGCQGCSAIHCSTSPTAMKARSAARASVTIASWPLCFIRSRVAAERVGGRGCWTEWGTVRLASSGLLCSVSNTTAAVGSLWRAPEFMHWQEPSRTAVPAAGTAVSDHLRGRDALPPARR
jgi:hypothetical protein